MRHRGFDLFGRKTIITGASSGIDRELALALAAKGATLALAARRRDLLDGLADEISRTGAPRPIVLPVDLALPEPPPSWATGPWRHWTVWTSRSTTPEPT
ncbi:SDR family NAD(P)-dependent oxidoreductase [Mycolicibacterium fortuitum]|uniref:SDR family NAD(P)-dependent oxidoreductase n=1 Tax=Mycolicibacterium fortuitum TaxID=1766 RepID=UPI0022A76CDC|nr:SDR family NAD(P)-dependent oxidoreductase [Mycolicibacterium fortuitum]